MHFDYGQYFLTHVFDELLKISPGKNQLATLSLLGQQLVLEYLSRKSHPVLTKCAGVSVLETSTVSVHIGSVKRTFTALLSHVLFPE